MDLGLQIRMILIGRRGIEEFIIIASRPGLTGLSSLPLLTDTSIG